MLRYAPAEFYRDFLNDISHYQGIIRTDHIVKVHLRPHPKRSDILLCDLQYQYTVNRLPRILKFKIHRLQNADKSHLLPLLTEECLSHEFVWHSGEYDFPSRGPDLPRVDLEDYSFSLLEVSGAKPHEPPKRIVADDRVILYELDRGQESEGPAKLKYKATIPVEYQSCIQITSEFVTRDSSIELNYSALRDKITSTMMSHAGLKTNILVETDDDVSVTTQSLSGWVLPRNGWVISWWKNE